MKGLLIFLILANGSFIVLGQDVGKLERKNTDTIRQLYARLEKKEDTANAIFLSAMSFTYIWSLPETSISYGQKALKLSQKLNYESGIANAHLEISRALTVMGNYLIALDNSLIALSLFENQRQGERIVAANAQIGSIYKAQNDYRNSLIYFGKALKDAEKLQLEGTPLLYWFIGSVYRRQNRPDSALLFLRRAYGNRVEDVGLMYDLGSAFFENGERDSAMYWFRKGLGMAANLPEIRTSSIDLYNGIALNFKALGNLDSATWYSKKVVSEKIAGTYPLGLLNASHLLSEIYSLQNEYDSAYRYLKIAGSLKDSLFNREKIREFQNFVYLEQEKQNEIEASRIEFQTMLKTYLLIGGLIAMLVIAGILLRNNRHRQIAFALLQKKKEEITSQKIKIEEALGDLQSTQAQLIQSAKMASLGELTAGIAHEIQNPLNFVTNFSEINQELVNELEHEAEKENLEEVKSIAKDIRENSDKINHHGKRADSIVKAMLQHSRVTGSAKDLTDINALAEEYLRLAYHGLRARDKAFNATLRTDFDPLIGKINIIPQDFGRVLLNLYNNAFYAVNDKQKQSPEVFEPTVSITTRKIGNEIFIKVTDNGNGIPEKVADKIFQPFFTTKPTGQGTGLGLSLSYDIIKAHGGEITVDSKENEGTTFTIKLTV